MKTLQLENPDVFLDLLKNLDDKISNANDVISLNKGSKKLESYCGTLIYIEFFSDLASYYINSGDQKRAIESLEDAESALNEIYNIYPPYHGLTYLAERIYSKAVKEPALPNYGGNLQ